MIRTEISILIVEDNPINAAQMINVVSTFTDDITVSTSAERGMLIFTQAYQGGSPYQILITDINLPGMSGKELVRDIRDFEEMNRVTSRIRVIAISADPPAEHLLEVCRVGGCYLEKPVVKEKLLEAIKKTGLLE